MASDSLVLFLTVLAALEREPAAGLAGAVRAGVDEVVGVCRAAGVGARLNVLAGDGERIVAYRASLDESYNSLYLLEHGHRWPRARLVASEPLDDDAGWQPVAEHGLVEVTAQGVRLEEPVAVHADG